MYTLQRNYHEVKAWLQVCRMSTLKAILCLHVCLMFPLKTLSSVTEFSLSSAIFLFPPCWIWPFVVEDLTLGWRTHILTKRYFYSWCWCWNTSVSPCALIQVKKASLCVCGSWTLNKANAWIPSEISISNLLHTSDSLKILSDRSLLNDPT